MFIMIDKIPPKNICCDLNKMFLHEKDFIFFELDVIKTLLS